MKYINTKNLEIKYHI